MERRHRSGYARRRSPYKVQSLLTTEYFHGMGPVYWIRKRVLQGIIRQACGQKT